MAFTLLATVVLAIANLVIKGVKTIVNTVTNTLWCVLAALGCVSISTSGYDYSGVSINRANLNKAPEAVDFDELARHGANINVADIESEYDTVVANIDKRVIVATIQLWRIRER